jgi:hypothetical protein
MTGIWTGVGVVFIDRAIGDWIRGEQVSKGCEYDKKSRTK